VRTARKTAISAIGLIAFLFFTPAQVVHHVWWKLILKQDAPLANPFVEEAHATVLSTMEEALAAFFPGVPEIQREVKLLTDAQKSAIREKARVDLDPELGGQYQFFVGKLDGEIVGYAVDDYVRGKWGLIHYAIHLDPQGQILKVMVLEYKEKRGRPVAKRRFLKQFKGKTIDDKIKLKKDIRGVTGASISSRGMTDGVRKMVHVFHEAYPTQ
jgi:Na+-translocating ferredoxin:NAD+ oxidoreductase RnfG subunit